MVPLFSFRARGSFPVFANGISWIEVLTVPLLRIFFWSDCELEWGDGIRTRMC